MTELYIGSHLSTAGGWNALLERSHEEGGTAFAFFPRSPYGKRSKALDPAGAAAFGARLKGLWAVGRPRAVRLQSGRQG